MLTVNYDRWNQSPQDLRHRAVEAEHPRTRECYLALYEITLGKSANQVSKEIKRRPDTVMDWVHKYNVSGDDGIRYKRTGGHPFLSDEIKDRLASVLIEALDRAKKPPQGEREAP